MYKLKEKKITVDVKNLQLKFLRWKKIFFQLFFTSFEKIP